MRMEISLFLWKIILLDARCIWWLKKWVCKFTRTLPAMSDLHIWEMATLQTWGPSQYIFICLIGNFVQLWNDLTLAQTNFFWVTHVCHTLGLLCMCRELIQGMIMGPFPLAVTKLLDLKKLCVSQISSTSVTSFYQHAYFIIWKGSRDVGTRELVSCCQLRSSTKIMSIISCCLKSNRGRQPWEYSLLCSVFHRTCIFLFLDTCI